jgi:hypothetical protein
MTFHIRQILLANPVDDISYPADIADHSFDYISYPAHIADHSCRWHFISGRYCWPLLSMTFHIRQILLATPVDDISYPADIAGQSCRWHFISGRYCWPLLSMTFHIRQILLATPVDDISYPAPRRSGSGCASKWSAATPPNQPQRCILTHYFNNYNFSKAQVIRSMMMVIEPNM